MRLVYVSVLILILCLVVVGQEKSPIPDPPSLNMEMIQSVLAEKDMMLNAKSIALVQSNATIDQLKKALTDKDAEMKKALAKTTEKKCN